MNMKIVFVPQRSAADNDNLKKSDQYTEEQHFILRTLKKSFENTAKQYDGLEGADGFDKDKLFKKMNQNYINITIEAISASCFGRVACKSMYA